MDLSIIIVNWNSCQFLRACLESVFQHTRGISFEVTAIDNASFDGSKQMIEEKFPQVRYIQSDANLGFAKANNLGYQYSSGRLLLFLNPDTAILDSALPSMVSCLSSLPHGGALGCKLLNRDGTLQTSCIQALPTILNMTLDAEALRACFPKSSLWGIAPLFKPGNEVRPVEMISGAALMVRREVFERAGMFTTDYFMYGEDADLCFKIAAAGWKLYYLPSAQIIHYGGKSTAQRGESSFSTLQMQESLYLYFRRNSGNLRAAAFRVSRAGTAIVRLTFMSFRSLFPTTNSVKDFRQRSIRKWKTILRWSLGLQEKVPARAQTSTQESLETEKHNTSGIT